MKYIITLLALLALLVSCSPSPEQIERAIEQTQVAKEESYTSTISNTNTPSATDTPTVTNSPTVTNTLKPTNTPKPTNTQTPPKETYIVTTGECLGYKDRYIPTGDPVGFEYCEIDQRKQTPLSSGDTVTFASFMPFTYPSFCAIHTLDGEYIMSDVDVDGLGKAVCTLP